MVQVSHAGQESSWQSYVEIKEPHFKERKRERRRQIEYMANFKNISGRVITKIRYETEFLNESGMPVYKMNASIVQKLKKKRTSRNKDFYVFKNNQYLTDDTYDILLPIIKNKRLKQNVVVSEIKFEDGDILKFR
jgi:hypothetical protein